MDGSILKSFAILLASVGIVFLVLVALKRVSKRFSQSGNSVELKVLSKLALQPKNHLYIVEADGKTLLLGVSEKSINTLAELSDSQRISSFSTTKPKSKKAFPDMLDTVPTLEKNDDLSFMSFLKSSVGMKSVVNKN